MIAAVTDSLNPNNDLNWRTPFWCENKDNIWEYRLHTAEEIRQVMSDGKLHLSTQILKNIEIQKQIEIANTEEEVNAIVW
jgi:hypothetical protein